MPWHLKARGEVVAELGPEMDSSGRDIRTWPMRPTESFESIREIILEDHAVQRELFSRPYQKIPDSVSGESDPQKRAEAREAWFQSDPFARRRFEVREQLEALELTVVDDTGAALLAWRVSIAQIPPLMYEEGMRADFERTGFRGGPPFFMVCALLAPPDVLKDVLAHQARLGRDKGL